MYAASYNLDRKSVVGGKKVTTYKGVFNLIDKAHMSISRVKDIHSMYNYLHKGGFGIMKKVIMYRDL
jgi:hypothetical protein